MNSTRKSPVAGAVACCFALGLALLAPAAASAATVTTDRLDYPPFSDVYIDGAGWAPGETVTVHIDELLADGSRTPVWDAAPSPVADATGRFTVVWYIWSDEFIGSTLEVTATGPLSGRATTVFTDAPPQINLDQARNGPSASPVSPVDFQNGNLGAQQSHFAEGQSAPYRAFMENMPIGIPITVVIGFDITDGGHNALDYLTH